MIPSIPASIRTLNQKHRFLHLLTLLGHRQRVPISSGLQSRLSAAFRWLTRVHTMGPGITSLTGSYPILRSLTPCEVGLRRAFQTNVSLISSIEPAVILRPEAALRGLPKLSICLPAAQLQLQR